MNDYFKMFLIALVVSVATQLLLTPYVLRLQGWTAASSPPLVESRIDQGSAPPSPSTSVALTAPNLEGMKVEDARERWRDRGLTIIEDGVRAGSGAAAGTILSQRPPAGTELEAKEIRVVVAESAQDVQVPDVLGRPIDEARAVLVGAGFEVPDPTREASNKPKGSVIRQIPNPGARAKSGTMVRLVIAEVLTVEVPKVKGMYLSQAKKALAEAGLRSGKVRRAEHPELGENYVLRQEPDAGEAVPPDTEIDLVVVAPN